MNKIFNLTFISLYFYSTEAYLKNQDRLKIKVNITKCQGHVKVKNEEINFQFISNVFMKMCYVDAMPSTERQFKLCISVLYQQNSFSRIRKSKRFCVCSVFHCKILKFMPRELVWFALNLNKSTFLQIYDQGTVVFTTSTMCNPTPQFVSLPPFSSATNDAQFVIFGGEQNRFEIIYWFSE